MIRFIRGEQLTQHPRLAHSMFRDRAVQFHDRLNWQVRVDDRGEERDEYDTPSAVYAIWERRDGRHGGSMRFMPTTGPVMVNDHFSRLAPRPFRDPGLWESTRFCLAPDSGPVTSAALMLAAATLGRGLRLDGLVGVFDPRMIRIYRRLGWEPEVLAGEGEGHDAIRLGLWRFDAALPLRLQGPARVPAMLARHWLQRAAL
jgi:acyl homoserine lactone synthase